MLGGYHTTLCEVDWHGEVVWEYVNPYQHHDFFRFDNGNTLVPDLGGTARRDAQARTRRPEEAARETAAPDRRRTARDRPCGPRSPPHRRLATARPRQGSDLPVDPALGVDARQRDRRECGRPDRVLRAPCEPARHHRCRTGRSTWKFDQTQHQHQPTWVRAAANGDDAENILVFDNGHAASRVVEIDPRANEIVWTFRGKPAYQFFSGHISGAVQLATRNVLVCEGTSGRLFEVNRDGRGRLGVDQPVPEHGWSRRTHREHLPRAPLRTGLSGLERTYPRRGGVREPEPASRTHVGGASRCST